MYIPVKYIYGTDHTVYSNSIQYTAFFLIRVKAANIISDADVISERTEESESVRTESVFSS